jgi:hypothetical protein
MGAEKGRIYLFLFRDELSSEGEVHEAARVEQEDNYRQHA